MIEIQKPYLGYYVVSYILTCCIKGNNSELIGWKNNRVYIHEAQDEYPPTHEEISYCPFCGSKIPKFEFKKDDLPPNQLDHLSRVFKEE